MKWVSYESGRGTRLGILHADGIEDVAERLDADRTWRDLQAALEDEPELFERMSHDDGDRRPTRLVPLDSPTRLRPPIARPPTVRDFMTHEGHASMGGQWTLNEAWYRLPVFYFSNPLCMLGANDDVRMPSATRKFDYELEVAIVVGREGRNVRRQDAHRHIAGFTLFVDWSSRDLQRDEMQLGLGPAKGKDSAISLGPSIVSLDELGPLWQDGQLQSRCTAHVNGTLWTDSTCGGMTHDWAALIERASRDSRIVPGDVIGGGCVVGGSIPEAIRLGFPARYLQPGDVVTVEVEGLGTVTSTLLPPELPSDGYPYLAPTRAK